MDAEVDQVGTTGQLQYGEVRREARHLTTAPEPEGHRHDLGDQAQGGADHVDQGGASFEGERPADGERHARTWHSDEGDGYVGEGEEVAGRHLLPGARRHSGQEKQAPVAPNSGPAKVPGDAR